MSENYVTNDKCEECCKRLDRENERQNERLRQLEANVDEINRLAVSTEKLASTMEQMLAEQKEQGKRISKLESRDGEKWRDVIKTITTVVVSAVVGAVLMMIGLK